MKSQRLRITITELPPRAHALTETQISGIFGGCDAPGGGSPATCDPKCPNCCEPYHCGYVGQAPYGSYFCTTG